MEKITADTIKELLVVRPGVTVEEFVEEIKERWLQHIDNVYDREISVVIKEYKEIVRKIINSANSL